MFVRFPNGNRWGRKSWICEAPDGNTALVGPLVGCPINGGPARWAKVKMHGKAGITHPSVDPTFALGPHLLF
jgi:hypothetical protein